MWISGGFVMSAFPLVKVRGEDRAAEISSVSLNVEDEISSPPEAARNAGWTNLDRAELLVWQGEAAFRLIRGQETLLVGAAGGSLLSPLSEQWAKVIAEADYNGPGSVKTVTKQTEPASEIRGQDPPLWRVAFDDSRETTI